jgi:hypothetical protein
MSRFSTTLEAAAMEDFPGADLRTMPAATCTVLYGATLPILVAYLG